VRLDYEIADGFEDLHEFDRWSIWRFLTCRRCYVPRTLHPTRVPVVSRAPGDRRSIWKVNRDLVRGRREGERDG
jgi:hypothetical protein